MRVTGEYYVIEKYSLNRLENIEEKKVIHQFENKGLIIDMKELGDRYTLNQLR